MLSADEESTLIQRAQAGEQAAKRKLIEAFQPLVRREATPYSRYAHDREGCLPDLIAQGNVGLLTALERFDLGLGNRFSTYAA